jgi:hypothetical protein
MLLVITSAGRTTQMCMGFDDQVAQGKNLRDLMQLRVTPVKEENRK